MLKVSIEYDASMRGYSLWIMEERPDGTIRLAKPVELEFRDPPVGVFEKPTLSFVGRHAKEFMGSLATALAEAGFRTDELQNVNKQIDAVKYHLEDMRTLVFKGKTDA